MRCVAGEEEAIVAGAGREFVRTGRLLRRGALQEPCIAVDHGGIGGGPGRRVPEQPPAERRRRRRVVVGAAPWGRKPDQVVAATGVQSQGKCNAAITYNTDEFDLLIIG